MNFEAGTLRAYQPKGGTDCHVPMNADVRELLRALPSRLASPWVFPSEVGTTALNSQNFINRVFHPALRRARISDFSWHDLRHTFASRLAMAGVDLHAIQELMGHQSLAMTLRYAHLSPAHKRDAVRQLEREQTGTKIDTERARTGTTTGTSAGARSDAPLPGAVNLVTQRRKRRWRRAGRRAGQRAGRGEGNSPFEALISSTSRFFNSGGYGLWDLGIMNSSSPKGIRCPRKRVNSTRNASGATTGHPGALPFGRDGVVRDDLDPRPGRSDDLWNPRAPSRYTSIVPRLQRKGFGGPDEVRRFPNGHVEIVPLDEIDVCRFALRAGMGMGERCGPDRRHGLVPASPCRLHGFRTAHRADG